tara:strand:- start:123 stop:1259 length:1137 start_codon:yes stop_codon:yes gene_type:complete
MMKMNNLLVIIAAAGVGKRFGSNIPKQYSKINGKTVIERSVRPFIDSENVSKVILAISKDDLEIKNQDFYNSEKIEFVFGGETRQNSIFNALTHVSNEYEYVLTHDAARPNVIKDDILNLLRDINESGASCSYLYTPVYDSIKQIQTEDKNKFHLVQTPQISRFNDLKLSLKKCIDENIESPDESSAIEYANLKTSRIQGRRSNIKITEPEDLEILNKFSTRSGIGFDLHKYEDGTGMVLGGFKINCGFKIIAHSDGDVLLHSIADSILGASGLGDIGKYFSDQDDKNKNLDSSEIIRFCLEKLNELNLEIYNIDATIICEEPKINPHRDNILKSLSSLLKIPVNKIGLKATTSEKIGIIGKNQAIAVQTIVNLRDKK